MLEIHSDSDHGIDEFCSDLVCLTQSCSLDCLRVAPDLPSDLFTTLFCVTLSISVQGCYGAFQQLRVQ